MNLAFWIGVSVCVATQDNIKPYPSKLSQKKHMSTIFSPHRPNHMKDGCKPDILKK